MFDVGEYDKATNNFTFGHGGFQGARGNNAGGDFFVENVWEEFDYLVEYPLTSLNGSIRTCFDAQGEFFFNESTRNLYRFYNGSGAPPADLEVFFINAKRHILHWLYSLCS